jgi:hypothetical protein
MLLFARSGRVRRPVFGRGHLVGVNVTKVQRRILAAVIAIGTIVVAAVWTWQIIDRLPSYSHRADLAVEVPLSQAGGPRPANLLEAVS